MSDDSVGASVDGTHWPVVIVGGGPVGMTLAGELGRRSVRTLLLDKQTGTTDNPRCNTTNARSMEYFRRLGVADQIRRAGLPLDHATDIVYCTSLTGYELTRFSFSSASEILDGTAAEFKEWPTPEPQHRISQIYLEPILDRHVQGYASVELLRQAEVTQVTQDADRAAVVATVNGRAVRITADYVVGCDGGASLTRRAIGATLQGDGQAAEHRLSVYFRSDELGAVLKAGARPGWMYWWYGTRLKGSFVQLNGDDLFLCHARVPEGEAPEDLDPDEVLDAALGRRMEHEKIQVVRWTPRRLVADRFVDRRVVLAGDAAHLWLPLGGFGMNTGIADAVGLGWRLAALVQGWGGPRLLSDYQSERRSVGEATSRAALKIDRDMATIGRDALIHDPGADGARLRREVGELITRIDRQQWHSQGVQFGARYVDSPGTVPTGEEPTQHTAVERIDVYEPSVSPGARFPHLWLTDGTSVFDELGPDFTLVRTSPASPRADEWVQAAADLGVDLRVVNVDDPNAASIYPRSLLLVRPDLYVAWSADAEPADIPAVLAHLVGRPTAAAIGPLS